MTATDRDTRAFSTQPVRRTLSLMVLSGALAANPQQPVLQGRTVPADSADVAAVTLPARLLNANDVRRLAHDLYAPIARRLNISGKVQVAALVGAGGQLARVEVRQSSGYKVLDNAALSVTRSMKFTPTHVRGDTTSIWILVPYDFHTKARGG